MFVFLDDYLRLRKYHEPRYRKLFALGGPYFRKDALLWLSDVIRSVVFLTWSRDLFPGSCGDACWCAPPPRLLLLLCMYFLLVYLFPFSPHWEISPWNFRVAFTTESQLPDSVYDVIANAVGISSNKCSLSRDLYHEHAWSTRTTFCCCCTWPRFIDQHCVVNTLRLCRRQEDRKESFCTNQDSNLQLSIPSLLGYASSSTLCFVRRTVF